MSPFSGELACCFQPRLIIIKGGRPGDRMYVDSLLTSDTERRPANEILLRDRSPLQRLFPLCH